MNANMPPRERDSLHQRKQKSLCQPSNYTICEETNGQRCQTWPKGKFNLEGQICEDAVHTVHMELGLHLLANHIVMTIKKKSINTKEWGLSTDKEFKDIEQKFDSLYFHFYFRKLSHSTKCSHAVIFTKMPSQQI